MLKIIVATFLLSLTTIAEPLYADEPRPSKYVNLNVEGATERLRLSNPAHYEKIGNIVDGLSRQPYDQVAPWLRTNFQARDVSYSAILLTSEPPQRDLSFVLDDTLYNARVTLSRNKARIYPVKKWGCSLPVSFPDSTSFSFL